MVTIEYKRDAALTTDDIIHVFERSGIKRPTQDIPRIRAMFEHASLVISAWDGETLIGVCRALTDFSYCCYLSDLAVDAVYQKRGIGTRMIEKVKDSIGEEVSLILLSAPDAMDYYPKIGFERIENGYIIKRLR